VTKEVIGAVTMLAILADAARPAAMTNSAGWWRPSLSMTMMRGGGRGCSAMPGTLVSTNPSLISFNSVTMHSVYRLALWMQRYP
jgi:hypothetical protein